MLDNLEEISTEKIFYAAEKGDDLAVQAVHEAIDYLGQGLATIATVIDPELFIIGGGVSKAGSFLLDQIKESYRKYAFGGCNKVIFKLAELKNDEGIYGAVKLIIDNGGY